MSFFPYYIQRLIADGTKIVWPVSVIFHVQNPGGLMADSAILLGGGPGGGNHAPFPLNPKMWKIFLISFFFSPFDFLFLRGVGRVTMRTLSAPIKIFVNSNTRFLEQRKSLTLYFSSLKIRNIIIIHFLTKPFYLHVTFAFYISLWQKKSKYV